MKKENKNDLVYLDTYVLQQDMRIRLPKSILNNLDIKKGESKFAIYLDPQTNEIILKTVQDNGESE